MRSIVSYFGLMLVMALPSLCTQVVAQETSPASAIWEMSDPATGGTGTAAATAGYIEASEETFVNTSINQYSGPENSQRVRIASNEWPANQTTPIEGVYIEYTVAPKENARLYLGEFQLGIAAASINTMKAEIRYSKDPAFATYEVIPYSTGLEDNYLRRDSLTWIDAEVELTVLEGQAFYVRIYPWVDNDPDIRTGKYVCLQGLVISGIIESIPVEASVIWPYDGDETYSATGNLEAAGPVSSPSMSYSGSTQMPSAGSGAEVMTGIYEPFTQDWYAETDTAADYYIQFAVFPPFGTTLSCDSLSLKIGGRNSATLQAALFASAASDFTSSSILIGDTPLEQDSVAKWHVSLNNELVFGDTLFLRIYPYNTVTESGAIGIVLDHVSVYGITVGITADPPTVTTAALSYVSTTFATCGGNIPSDGGNEVIQRGVAWNTEGEPIITDDHTVDGTGSGSFVSQITGLTPGTTYYVRAYAKNGAGTSYGEELELQALSAIMVPTVTTASPDNIMVVSAEGGGEVTLWGGDSVTARGVCWNTTGDPTIADGTSLDGEGLGSFNSYIYPLTENTTYYIRAYATNSAGTGYGGQLTFTTQTPAPDVIKTVAADGSGDYTSVQAAFDDVPENYTGRYTIFVKPGTYYEKLILEANKINVVLQGAHADSSILTYDDNANSDNGSGGTVGTSGSYSVAIDADDFIARDITFRNTNQEAQAVALRTNGDRLSFYRCKIQGYQDTYYAWGGSGTARNYFRNCLIEGSVDFIFGRNIVVFDSCVIRENRNGGELTAASTEPESKFGFVFIDCIIEADATGYDGAAITSFSLGRPWQKAPRTVFINCYEPASLDPAGWDNWNVVPALYAEYSCYGPGSDITYRNPVSRQLTEEEAAEYTLANIFARESNPLYSFDWMPATDYYKLGQTISFEEIGEQDINWRSLVPELSVSSNLPLTLESSNTGVATIEEGTILFVANGTAEITASQPGNFMYNAAADVSRTLTITGEVNIDQILEEVFSLYPNPASDHLQIMRDTDDEQMLRIIRVDGQIVHEELLNTAEQVIDLSDLEKGFYLVQYKEKIYKLVLE
ncbi:MAG: T9SS type A sorting domain-containing protein [Bacteroidales bacterium]|nr:T9SS type A sorting domain-containing protein [Bacteroidales bacterium]